jgi:selenocysteine-specific elongation factor
MAANTQQVNLTLGTAGHIDHGKTALVELLTGCKTDRLKEEIERGMSIELGFAPCRIADLEVGIVDVPGHEHFIKTMVAGATGMDAVLLVVAADDGIMPQTREHLDILTLLGVRHGLVALTKIDRVGPERVEEMRENLAAFLRGTFLEGAPVLPLSNITGEGLDGFLKGLQALVRSVKPRTVDGVFRLPVERTFSVKGYGTVITGIPQAGQARVGDEIVLLPEGLSGRIAALQVYGREADTARAGQCAAVNVRHWEAKAIARGSVLTLPGYFEPTMWFACGLRLLPHPECTLKNGGKIKFHAGTSEIPGTVYLMEGDRAAPGTECLVQVRVDRPLVAGPCDRFILRTQSPPVTIGGGMMIEATDGRLKRNRPEVKADLEARAKAVPQDATFVEYCLAAPENRDSHLFRAPRAAATASAPAGVQTIAATEADLSHRAKVMPRRLQEILKELVTAGRAIALPGGLFVHRDRAADTEKRLLGLLAEFHKASPESPGMAADALVEAAALSKPVGEGMLARLKAAGRLADRGGLLALADHRQSIGDEDRAAVERVEQAFRDRAFAPPAPDEAAAVAKVTPDRAAKAVRLLTEQKRLVQVAPGMLFHAEAIARARQLLSDHIRKKGCLESVDFKYLLDTTRKYAIPLLDYFDRVGVTRAVGHTRYLRPPRPQGP